MSLYQINTGWLFAAVPLPTLNDTAFTIVFKLFLCFIASVADYYEYAYGVRTLQPLTELEVELLCFLKDRKPENGGLGKFGHFKKIVSILWPEKNSVHFFWHPWAEKMIEEACKHKYLGIIGCASSGKSDAFAVWAIINWLCSPKATLVMVTSTSLKDSRRRIWGALTKYFNYSTVHLPGRLVDSMGIIRTDDGSGKFDDRQGISLIAGEKKKEREAIGKLIGMKNNRVFLIADELPELSEAIYEAALTNLTTNPNFQMVGIGNFASVYDPLGVFVKPKNGYDSITPHDTEWETETGYCLRFDGLKSPNVLAGEDIWPKIYSNKMLREHRNTLGENTLGFWRMVRSFPCPAGSDNTIYSDADLVAAKADEKVYWLGNKIKVAAFDPSFTNGGDRAVVMIGSYGLDKNGKNVLCYDRHVILREDVTLKDKSRSFQIVQKFMELCIKEGVYPQYAAVDATAGGKPIYDIICELWSHKVLPVQFGGSASKNPVGIADYRPADELYANRVSELWYVGLEFLKSGQLKGIFKELAMEMKSRHYETVKGTRMRIKVESKVDMKARIGFSPDIADAAFIMLDLCRVRLGAKSGEGSKAKSRMVAQSNEQAEAIQDLYSNADYSDQNADLIYESSHT